MKKIILAITGASGSIYSKTLIEQIIASQQVEKLAIVRSSNALLVWEHELQCPWVEHPSIQYFNNTDFMAPFASGSSRWDAMIVLPASMGMIARIANGTSYDLISRAADVMLKEQRKLVICPRETPFNRIHLKNMLAVQEAGATILATSPSFYNRPKTVIEITKTVTNRIIDHLDIEQDVYRWSESNTPQK